MRAEETEFEQLDVKIRIVTFDADFMARAYVKQTDCPWTMLIDSERKLYRGYGMLRGNWWKIIGPVSLVKYIGLMFRGNQLHRPGADYRQLGGDVLVDPQGIVQLHFVSDDPHDRPAVETILNIVREAQA